MKIAFILFSILVLLSGCVDSNKTYYNINTTHEWKKINDQTLSSYNPPVIYDGGIYTYQYPEKGLLKMTDTGWVDVSLEDNYKQNPEGLLVFKNNLYLIQDIMSGASLFVLKGTNWIAVTSDSDPLIMALKSKPEKSISIGDLVVVNDELYAVKSALYKLAENGWTKISDSTDFKPKLKYKEKLYAYKNPEWKTDLNTNDEIRSEDTGIYILENGKWIKVKTTVKNYTIGKLSNKFDSALIEPSLVKDNVLYGYGNGYTFKLMENNEWIPIAGAESSDSYSAAPFLVNEEIFGFGYFGFFKLEEKN